MDHMDLPANYDKLSMAAGVDFTALREKYKDVAKAEQEKAKKSSGDMTKGQSEAMKAMQRLDDYKICNTCHGQGVVKELYNHFWQEKDCPDCDGEAVMLRQMKNIEESLIPKVN